MTEEDCILFWYKLSAVGRPMVVCTVQFGSRDLEVRLIEGVQRDQPAENIGRCPTAEAGGWVCIVQLGWRDVEA